MTTQTKINTESDAGVILGAIIQMQHVTNGLLWTEKVLSHVLNMTPRRVTSACKWLKKSELISTHSGEYIVTDNGRAYYKGCCISPHINASSSVLKFRDEVRSGMTDKGLETKIEKACLPSLTKNFCDDRTAEEILIGIEEREKERAKLAKRLRIAVEDLDRLHKEERINVCRKCGEIRIFNASGQCVKCKTALKPAR